MFCRVLAEKNKGGGCVVWGKKKEIRDWDVNCWDLEMSWVHSAHRRPA